MEEKKKRDMSWWQSPDYVAKEEALQAQAKEYMKTAEQRAVRDRNAAMIGDIARLGAQAWAKKGGAWNIDKATPASAAANTKLQELRDKNAANMLMYAQRMQEAQGKDRADAMNKKQFELELEQQDAANELARAKAAAEAQKDQNDFLIKRAQVENQKERNRLIEEANKARAKHQEGVLNNSIERTKAYKAYVGSTGERRMGSIVPIAKGDGNFYNVREKVYKANIPDLYEAVKKDVTATPEGEELWAKTVGIDVAVGSSVPTEKQMDNAIKALLSKSPAAQIIMQTLTNINPTSLGMEYIGYPGDDSWDGWKDSINVDYDFL